MLDVTLRYKCFLAKNSKLVNTNIPCGRSCTIFVISEIRQSTLKLKLTAHISVNAVFFQGLIECCCYINCPSKFVDQLLCLIILKNHPYI